MDEASTAGLRASLQVSRDFLVVASPGHVAALTRQTWSPSGMGALEGCAARWAVERLLPETVDPFGAAPLGTSAHRLLELLYGEPAAGRTLERAVEFLSVLHDDPGVVAPQAAADKVAWRAAVMERVRPLWRAEDPCAVRVHATETRMSTTVAGVPFLGVADRVDALGDGGIAIVDYKTGKPVDAGARSRFGDKHGDQLRLYVLAWEAQFGVRPSGASIIYTGAGQTYRASLASGELAKVSQKFAATFEAMHRYAQRGEYPYKAGGLCGYCPLATLCPAAAKAGKSTPKVDHAWLGARIGLRAAPLMCAAPATPTRRDEPGAAPPKRPAVFQLPLPPRPAPPPGVPVPPSYLSQTTEGDVMKFLEDGDSRPFCEVGQNGNLNPGSYAAKAAFGLTTLAAGLLNEQGVRLSRDTEAGPGTITALATVLKGIVAEAQRQLGLKPSLQAGSATRLIGALRTVIEIDQPVLASAETFGAWVERATARVVAIATSAANVWDGDATDPATLARCRAVLDAAVAAPAAAAA